MSARPPGAREREVFSEPVPHRPALDLEEVSRMVVRRSSPGSTAGEGYSTIRMERLVRVSLMLIPHSRGRLHEQADEILAALQQILQRQGCAMTVTSQTVFLRDSDRLAECEHILSTHFGVNAPVTNFVFQPPCCGAALALEAWAIGGPHVRVERPGPHTRTVSYDGTRWIYCAGLSSPGAASGVYGQTTAVLQDMRQALEQAGAGFEHVLRTWFYLGSITQTEAGIQRYKELNRARTDFYRGIKFPCSAAQPSIPQGIYPASTGIGMLGTALVGGCVALQTQRPDAVLLPLENPQQTPAYAYHPRHSPHSPKFSRGVALVLEDYVTTWLSGTASVVHSLSRHPGDIHKQTEQTIENIDRLLSTDNFRFHGIKHSGARLQDLAKIRVYLKRPVDFALCKAICEKHFGSVPAIYAVADICRPELLIEIEGVAFTKRHHAPDAVPDRIRAQSERD